MAASTALQVTYTEAAYESQAALPAHHLDHFIAFATLLARQKTQIAQGLCDAGIMQLVDAIRNGWYPYLPAQDFEPPEVRKMLRQRMCDDALKVLSERLYLAAQAQLLYQSPSRTTPPVSTAAGSRRLRRRPSWMATGG